MKILAIGDPHGCLNKIKKIPIKDIDLILITGDLAESTFLRKKVFKNIEREKKGLAKIKETEKDEERAHLEIHNSTIKLLNYLAKKAPVFSIRGNIGIPNSLDVQGHYKKYGKKLPNTREKLKSIKDFKLVRNRLRIIDGLRIGFLDYFLDTCWVKEFKPKNNKKAMKRARKETNGAKRVLKKFKKLDILLCHQPPYKILDKVSFKQAPKHWKGKHAGSKVILDYIKKHQPKLVLCGHIHEGKGEAKIGRSRIINLGSCGGYKVVGV